MNRITVFIKSEKISTSSADTESLGHQCANPMRTGAYDRMGGEAVIVTREQRILLDAVTRACEKMNWDLVFEDVSKYGFLKKLRANETIPRIEGNGLVLRGIHTSEEIIQFFNQEDAGDEIRIEISHESNGS